MAIDERGVNLKVTATNETQQGFEGVKQSAREMANTVTQESGRASQSVGKIGDGGQQASQKVERSTRSMIQSIQRTTAAMEAGSRTSAKYYETLAKQRGVDPEVLRPYLNQLEEVRLKQEQASAALGAGTIQLNQYGMSAKQTAAALRGVPAQLTDIFVSLQGGQRPMTVLLQQGGQLRDMFGGIVPAAQALGTTLLKMVNPMTLAAGAAVGLYAAYRAGASETENFQRTLLMTGNAAGVTADQLNVMAERVSRSIGTQRQAAAALNEFARSGKIAATEFERFSAAAVQWEKATGSAISETVKQFEELSKAPLEASLKLNDSMNYLTESTYRQIKALQEAGRETDAASLAQRAFSDAIHERAPGIVSQVGTIERAWHAVKGAISGAAGAMMAIGRPETVESLNTQLQAKLAQLRALQEGPGFADTGGGAAVGGTRGGSRAAEGVIANEARLLAAEVQMLMQEMTAAQLALQRKKELEQAVYRDSYLGDSSRQTQAEQRAAAIKAEQDAFKKAVVGLATDSKEYERIYAAHKTALLNIDKQYEEKKQSSGGISTTQTELARLNALLEAERQREEALHSLGLAQANLNEGEKLAIQYAEKLKLATDEKTKAQLTANKALAEEYGARKRANDEFDKELKARQSAIDAAKKQTERLRDEIETYGMGKSAIEAMTIARLEERLAVDEAIGASAGTIESLKQEISARKELYDAMRTKEQLDAQLREWQSWEREVDRIFDQLGQSLTDQLFEGGKSARDMLKDMFKALTLRVVVQPMLAGLQGMVTQQIGGLLGFSDPRQQGGGILGTAQNLYSGYNALNGGLNSTLGNAAQWLGQKIGSEALTSFGLGLSGTTAATGIASIGAGLGASLGTSIGTSAAAMTTTTFSAALSGGAAAGGAAAASGAAAGGAAGVGAAVGAALPWIGGALAIGSAFGLFDREPTTRRSQRGASHMLPDGTFEIAEWDDRQDAASQQAARSFAEQAVKSANELFAKAGVDAAIWSFQTLMESSIKGDRQGVGSSGQVRIGDDIRDIGLTVEPSWTRHGFGGWSEAEMLPRLMTDVQLTILEAFQVAGDALPSVLSGMLEGVDIRSLGAEQAQALAQQFSLVVDQVSTLQGALEQLPFEQLRDLSFDAAANLIQFAGGLEQLDAGMTSYFQNFYSEAEQLDWATQQIGAAFDELGLTMPDVTQGADAAKAAYRELVESLDVTTEEGQRAYATLMTLSGGFAELVVGMDELNNAVVETARSAADIARERMSLENQILQLEGNTVELRRRELEALDPSNRALQEYIWLLQDQADAAQAQASAISGAWANFGTMAGLAAQHTGNGAGLQAQLSVAQASYAGADNTADRVAALQEIIRLEQSIWGLQQEGRKAEADAARASIEASQQQLSNANKLLNAAQSLGNYAQSLFGGKDSGMSGADRMQFLQSEYETLLARARSGDADAMGKLQGASSEYLSVAQQMAGSQEDYSVLSGTIASELATVSAIQVAAASSQASMLERQIKQAQEQAAAISSAQFEVSDQTRILIESLLGESTDGFKDTLRSMSELIDQEKATLAAIRGWPATLNGIMSQTLVPSINGIAQSAANSAVSAYIAANAAAEEQRLRRAAELAAQALREQMAAMQAAAEAAKEGGLTVPALAVGTNYVPKTQLALLHEGEAVLPKAFNPWAGGGIGDGGMVAELRALRSETEALRKEVAALKAPMEQTAAATTEHKDMFENASAGGNALAVEVMA